MMSKPLGLVPFVLALGLAARILSAQVDVAKPVARADATLRERLSALAEDTRSQAGIPGLGVAVRTQKGTVLAFGLGIADLENDVPVTEQTVFRLASISKPFTAVAALRLAERGELDLDRDVSEFVPAWPKQDHAVTCRLLLGHLGGVRHYRPGEIASNRNYADVAEALHVFADDELLHAPGTKYLYSTYGFNLVGAAIAVAGKASFADVLQREVLSPAGCTTLVVDDPLRIVRHRAQGYQQTADGLRNARPVDVTNKVPGGGLCSTPTDLVRFAGALLDGTLLQPETLELAWTSQRTKDGKATGYGHGFNVAVVDGHRIASHGGAQPRVSTLLWIDRDDQTAIALMSNLEGTARPLRELALRLSAALR